MDLCRLDKADSHSIPSAWKHQLFLDSIRLVGYFRRNHLEKQCHDVRKVQDNILQSILKLNGDTIYGQDFQLKKIQSRDQFILQHPLTNYSHYESYFNRTADGEKNLVCSRSIKRFARTSGTTGKSKLIPMTKDTFAAVFLDALGISYYQLFSTFPKLRNLQKTLRLSFSGTPQVTPSGIEAGPASGAASSNPANSILYTTPLAAYDILTEPEALYVYVLFALKEISLGCIDANFGSSIFIMFKTLETKWCQFVDDIRNGILDPKLDIPEDVRNRLNRLLKPDKRRADELEAIFQSGFDSVAVKIWPKLKIIFTTTTGSMEVYGRVLKTKYCKGILHFSPFYGASEGLFAVNIHPDVEDTQYVIIPHTLFYEFIPEEDCDEENPQTKFLDQLTVDQNYELVITNFCGLYRYRMGDVVRVVGFHQTSPIIQFMHRRGQLLNINTEKFAESLFYRGLSRCIDQWKDTVLVDYTCAESILLEEKMTSKSSQPYYLVFLELAWNNEQNRILDPSEKLLLDTCLQDVHPGYKKIRSNESVASARVIQVQPGTFYKLRQYLIQVNSASTNQFKIPRALRNVQAVELLLENDIQPK